MIIRIILIFLLLGLMTYDMCTYSPVKAEVKSDPEFHLKIQRDSLSGEYGIYITP